MTVCREISGGPRWDDVRPPARTFGCRSITCMAYCGHPVLCLRLRRSFRRWMWKGCATGRNLPTCEPRCCPAPASRWRSASPSCGGDAGSGGDADPASLVPANAAMYFEATIRPEGEQREEVLAAAGKIMRTPDPAAKIQELVDEGFKDEDLTWERDFAPWVGEKAGVWLRDVSGEDPPVARRDRRARRGGRRGGAAQAAGRRRARDLRGRQLRRWTTRTRPRGSSTAIMVVGDLPVFKAGRRRARRRPPGRRRTATRTSSTSSRTIGSASSTSTRRRSSTRR